MYNSEYLCIFAYMKKNVIILIAILTLITIGCKQEEKEEVPADLIPREQMIDIVVDAWFMESTIHMTVPGPELEVTTVTLYEKFFPEHHITREQFVSSLEYYTNEEKASENFIRECIQRLENRQEELTGVSNQDLQLQ